MNQILQNLINNGIPVSRAQFHQAVNNADNIPETNFAEKSDNVNRRVQMWSTPMGLICMQKSKYFMVPTANIIFANLKADEALVKEESKETKEQVVIRSAMEMFQAQGALDVTDAVQAVVKKRGRPFKDPTKNNGA